MKLTVLVAPGLCILAVTLIYGLLVRWLFRRRLDRRLAWFAFLASAVLVGLSIAAFFLGGIEHALTLSLLGDLQTATSFGAMFKLALIYAALPEEAAKIAVVVILLLALPRWQRYRSDPAEMLLYSGLGFATCESLLYLAAFTALPQFQEHALVFALARGVFGGLLHGLLGMVAGFFLAWRWRGAQRWLGLLSAYASAVLLHAAFDGSLLHLVLETLKAAGNNADLAAIAGVPVMPFLGSAAALLVFGLTGLICSRRLGAPLPAPSSSS